MRRKRRHDIIIELTSLLDVIMIIIFMVMKENSQIIGEKQNTINAAQQVNSEQASAIDDLTEQIADLSSQLNDTANRLDEAEGKLDEGSVEELLDRLHAAESKLESYMAVDDVVIVLNISLENRYNNTVRCMTYGKSSYGAKSEVSENRGDADFEVSLNKLKVFISEYITKVINDKDNQTIVYIVFTYDPHKVYQRDYEAITEALTEADKKANNGNFRYRINPISD